MAIAIPSEHTVVVAGLAAAAVLLASVAVVKRDGWLPAVRSHERLVDLIEEGNGPGAEQHWLNHMRKAGEHWPDKFAETSVVDILDM